MLINVKRRENTVPKMLVRVSIIGFFIENIRLYCREISCWDRLHTAERIQRLLVKTHAHTHTT